MFTRRVAFIVGCGGCGEDRRYKATPVYVEMEAPLLWSMGVEPGTTRTVIQLYTDDGIVGLGETYGGAEMCRRIEEARPLFIGLDPFELQTMVSSSRFSGSHRSRWPGRRK